MSSKTPSHALRTINLAIGTAFAATLSSASVMASENPFASQELEGGYMVAGHAEGKCGGNMKQAGEGKCGGKMKDKKGAMEGKCGDMDNKKDKMKKAMEGKCGEGKCGGMMKNKADGAANKMKEGKCGDMDKKKDKMKKAMEGKCGEGKCGGMMK